MNEDPTRIVEAAREVVDSISFDVNGALIGGKWMGGHGGLVSRETIAKSDALRRAINAFDSVRKNVPPEAEAK